MAMRFQAELCHIDTLRCVVRVVAWQTADQCLGSCLGEAASAEEAEDRARQRLLERLNPATPPTQEVHREASIAEPSEPSTSSAAAEPQHHREQVSAQPSETPSDPEDWSEELTALDLELQRLGWDRSQEKIFLERSFGHGSRHRLTRYADLVAYLRQLKQLQPGDLPEQASVPIRRSDLISQGDQMLRQLGWNGDQARGFLQQSLQATSRQQLSDDQLLQFNMLLEEQTLKLKQ